jgi:hypothetical protein
VAASSHLALIATSNSDDNTISVFRLTTQGPLVLVATYGGPSALIGTGSDPPLQFRSDRPQPY